MALDCHKDVSLSGPEKLIYSFVVDSGLQFTFQGFSLARSIVRHCGAVPGDINFQLTPSVPDKVRTLFSDEGYKTHALEPFGDHKYCNKLSQIPNLLEQDHDRLILLDTDMIAVGDPRSLLSGSAVQAKVVDLPNPPLETLLEIFEAAGGRPSSFIKVDAGRVQTVTGNANGGFYAVPKSLAAPFSTAWRKWVLWLLDNDSILRRAGYLANTDQIGAALAFHFSGIDFTPAPSNLNFFLHLDASHRYHDRKKPLVFLHYHNECMNADGFIVPKTKLSHTLEKTVGDANRQIADDLSTLLARGFAR